MVFSVLKRLITTLLFALPCYVIIVNQIQAEEISTKDQNMRNSQHSHISKYLETLSDNEILTLLKKGISLQSRWGTTLKLEIDGVPIFVKQVPLNEIEGNLKNIRSTENLFKLPLFYQYGVGSGGFSVWRELSAHAMTTEWVLNEENQNFPLMYHWRTLNSFQEKKPFDEEEFNKYVAYWDNSTAIGERVRANHKALANVVIFVEYIPETLKSWLNKEFKKGNTAIDKAIAMVEENLQATSLFLNEKEMLHFDAHFHNILTDGKRLYFSDFGLAISSQFTLSKEESDFFRIHSNYDRYYVATELTNWIVSNTFGKDCVDEILEIYANGKAPLLLSETLTPYLSSIIKRYAPIALRMNSFFEILVKKTKQEPYPAAELDQLWNEIVLCPRINPCIS